MQNASFLCNIILSSVARQALPHFPTLCHKWHDFRKRVLDIKLCFDFFYVLLTVHPRIVLQISPTWCTVFLSIRVFISFLYMFRAATL